VIKNVRRPADDWKYEGDLDEDGNACGHGVASARDFTYKG